MRSLLSEKYFYGFLSHEEAIRLLETEDYGTYLVRFSNSTPGNFAFEYVFNDNGEKAVGAIKIGATDEGYKVEGSPEIFKSINEILRKHDKIFLFPFRTELPKFSWFHGDLSSEEAETFLSTEPEGTFLFRFSSQPLCLTCSYHFNGFMHTRINRISGSDAVLLGETKYDSVEALIYENSELLKYPYQNPNAEKLFTLDQGKIKQHKSQRKPEELTNNSYSTLPFAQNNPTSNIKTDQNKYYYSLDQVIPSNE